MTAVGMVENFVGIEYQYLYIKHCGDNVSEVKFEPYKLWVCISRMWSKKYVRQSLPRQRYKFQSDGQFLKMYFIQRMHYYNVKGNRLKTCSLGCVVHIVASGDLEFSGFGQKKFLQTFVPNGTGLCLRRLYDFN